MTNEMYGDVMLPYFEGNMPSIWKYQQDNDPKTLPNVSNSGLQKIVILEWPVRSRLINLIENVWNCVKNSLYTKSQNSVSDN